MKNQEPRDKNQNKIQIKKNESNYLVTARVVLDL